MRTPARLLQLFFPLAACLLTPLTWAGKQTVCTVTINSADEQKTFRRFLPADKYDFVELVDRNRPDWLASACEAKVSCDVLIVSGHHGEGNVFFSDALDRPEHLPIAELERVSCSGSCPTLFANLKEVYLFGCNTLNPQPQHTMSGELARSYVREGSSPAEAAKLARLLGPARGESSRDRMRMVFRDVPAIYGFSSVAPLGAVAAVSLNKYFQKEGTREVGKGHASGSLLRQFSSNNMVATRGIGAGDPLTPMRQDMCTFADDRLSVAQRVDAIHELLKRPEAETRLLLERFEGFVATLDASKRQQPDVAQALQRIASDGSARDRYLAFARDADELQVRARMVQVAHELAWLSPEQRRDEFVAMLGDMLARKEVGAADVNLACTLNDDHGLDGALDKVASRAAEGTGHSAVRACTGSAPARARVLDALVSPHDADVQVAQSYLRHRPITDPQELRSVTKAIAAMNSPEAQARALDVLARHYVSDGETVKTLKNLFAKTRSAPVQNAIAGALMRADPKSVTATDLLPTLREFRLPSSAAGNMVDALIGRLQAQS